MAKSSTRVSVKVRARTSPSSTGAAAHDPVRIVPLHLPTAAAVAETAKLTYRNGPLMAAVQVFTMFWGSKWQQAPQTPMIGQLNAFFDFILTSPLIDQLAEYNVPKYTI